MIPGTTLNMGGRDFTIAPLTLRALRELTPQLEALTTMRLDEMPKPEQLGAVVDVVWSAVKRNHQEITREQVEEMLDLGNLQPAIEAVMGTSGIRRRAVEGEAPSSGGSTGPASTGS